MNEHSESLDRLVEAVRQAGADIAPTYAEYIQLAFAIATDCGEAGRSSFHELCSLCPKYQYDHAEKLFTNAIRSSKGDVHLGTAFHLAELAGVMVSSEVQKNANLQICSAPSIRAGMRTYNTQPDENDVPEIENTHGITVMGSDPYSPLPFFPNTHTWPSMLEEVISHGKTPQQKDVLLLGALTALGASLGRHVRCKYGKRWISPSMQTFVVAPPASGKGVLSWVRRLVLPIHKEIRAEVEEQMNAYRKEKVMFDNMGKERKNHDIPIMPANRMFLIPGNNSSTGILQNIMDSDGTGLIFECEADTVTAAIGTDYGNWSDTLRKAYDHSSLSYNRRTDHEYREVEKTYLSVLLSGTPAQVQPLIPSAENGLFSRQNFYYMPAIGEWEDQFGDIDDDIDADEEFYRMGQEWLGVRKAIQMNGIYILRLTREQRTKFDNFFHALFHRSGITNGDEMKSSVLRLGINACRLMSVVAMLRWLENPSLATPHPSTPKDNRKDGIINRWNLAIKDEDFQAVLAMMETLYLHATHILSFLNPIQVSNRYAADKDALFAAMDEEFTRQEVLAAAKERNIPEATASSWLARLLGEGKIVAIRGKRGHYQKV